MGEKIKLFMEDWLYNSGLVGFYNILQYAEDIVTIEDNYLEFEISHLENFEEKYFTYFIEKYKDILSLNKITSFEDFLLHHENSNFKEFGKKDLEGINKYISDIVKRQIKSNSYKSAYDLIGSPINILQLEKDLKPINLKKGQTIEEVLPEIRDKTYILKQIIDFLKDEKSKRYIGAKNTMYTVINNGWNGVSLLNPQTKEKDMYMDYKNYFVQPVVEYFNDDVSKFRYRCFSCDRLMKDFTNDLSFINKTGFDVNKKASHVWDFQNDVAVCPLCKLIYSCVPAGISYIYDKGIFINDNSNMEDAIDINNKLYMEIYKQNPGEKKLTYRALVESIKKEHSENLKYELADIQLVRYENNTYKFNILSKQALRIIRESKKELDRLINAGFKEINTYFNVYELVIDRLLNSQNMFTLVQKMLHYKISRPNDSYYHAGHILSILEINNRFLEEVGYMKESDKDIVKQGNASGYYLREMYKSKSAQDKLNGVAYRLLNSLKTNNTGSFMDTVLNCYLYVKAPVPQILISTLRSEEKFKTIGYAFVAGLIEGKSNDENGGKE